MLQLVLSRVMLHHKVTADLDLGMKLSCDEVVGDELQDVGDP